MHLWGTPHIISSPSPRPHLPETLSAPVMDENVYEPPDLGEMVDGCICAYTLDLRVSRPFPIPPLSLQYAKTEGRAWSRAVMSGRQRIHVNTCMAGGGRCLMKSKPFLVMSV